MSSPTCEVCGLRHPLLYRWRGRVRRWHEGQHEREQQQDANMRRARAEQLARGLGPTRDETIARRHALLLRALTGDRSPSA